MAQIIIKTIKNHDYAYVYRSFRDPETKQPRKTFVKYLGPVNRADVQRAIKEFKACKREFFTKKSIKRKRVPEINPEDIQELSPWEKIFLATAIVVQEKAKTAYLDDILELAKEYCKKAKIAHPAAWDQSVDYFKTVGWLELKTGRIKFLLPESRLREIKRKLISLMDKTPSAALP